jgi:hypothetical protein
MRALALLIVAVATLPLITPRPSAAMPVASGSQVRESATSIQGVENARYRYRPYYRPYVYRPYYYGPHYYPYYYHCWGCGWPFSG